MLDECVDDFFEYIPNRLMSKKGYIVFLEEYFKNEFVNDFNKIHF